MEILVTILHVMVCIFLMLTVLLQAGKGGGMGAAFGGGSSMGTVFGGSGAGTFLRRLTVVAAVIFLFTSMILAWMATPSTDPLKEYWAEQQAAKEERNRAHEEALKAATGETKAAVPVPVDKTGTQVENETPPPDEQVLTIPPAERKKMAEEAKKKAEEVKKAEKGKADTVGSDKAATDMPATDMPAKRKAATDKPATPTPTEPAPSQPSGSNP